LVTATDGYFFGVTDTEQPPPVDDPAERQRWLDRKRLEMQEEQTSGSWHRGILQQSSSPSSTHSPGWEQRPLASRALHRVGEVAGGSIAGIVAAILVVVWTIVGLIYGFPTWWQTVLYSVTGSVTFVMVFVIQHAQERQTSGTQRKLDELIRASSSADNALIAVEEAPDEHLQALTHLNIADRSRAAGEDGEGGALP
jgi:low affinity Fe/Cu permease